MAKPNLERTDMNITSITDDQNTTTATAPKVSKTRVEIYISGSCIGNPGPTGSAFFAILFNETGLLTTITHRSQFLSSNSTNNRAEIDAALSALDFVRECQTSGVWAICPVTIHSNVEYLVKGINEDLEKWTADGWRLADGSAPKNFDLWERLKAAKDGLSVEWHKIPSRSGNSWIKQAKLEAKNAALGGGPKGDTFRIPLA